MKIRKSPAFVLPALVPAAGSSLPRRGGGWTVRKKEWEEWEMAGQLERVGRTTMGRGRRSWSRAQQESGWHHVLMC